MIATPPLSFLADVQNALYWRTLDGEWRHNTRPLRDGEAALLDVWAVCRPGGTARLGDAGWRLLHSDTLPEETP